jgi:MFS family permease
MSVSDDEHRDSGGASPDASTGLRDSEREIHGKIGHDDSYAAWRFTGFRRLVVSGFAESIGSRMVDVAVGWELYARTHSAVALGLVGLVQIVPAVLLALPAGHVADRFDRRRIAVATTLLLAGCSAGLTLLSWTDGPLPLVYLCLALMGAASSVQAPATASMLAQVVPGEWFGNAATWQSGVGQTASIGGPALGGLMIAATGGATAVYAINAATLLAVAPLIGSLRLRPFTRSAEKVTVDSLLAGLHFVRATKEILAASTLDLFAVLLGGTTALLPIFAEDVLHVGPTGLGLMRAAPAAGAVLTALVMAHRPPFRHAGWTLLSAVAGFGLATIGFGLSRSLPLSLLFLAALGGLDAISMVIRDTLLLTRTPDELRGRVTAVEFVFVGLSNQLGEFESGMLAALIGAVGAVIAGGIGTLLVVPVVALAWPELRRLGRMVSDEG